MSKSKIKRKHKECLNIRRLGCCDIFSFYYSIAKIIALGVRELGETTYSFPSNTTMKEWKALCKGIADDIEEFVNYHEANLKKEMQLEKKAHRAIMRFAKHWRSFWI